MNTTQCYLLPHLSVLDLVGADADAILNNLTTNHVLKLEMGQGCESFVTDVRGKTVGHFNVYRHVDGFRLIGSSGQSERVAAHVDRYTIREDAKAEILDSQFAGFVLSSNPFIENQCDLGTELFAVTWLGAGAQVWLVPNGRVSEATAWLDSNGIAVADVSAFHAARTIAGYPWYGIEIDESNLPQEIGRDAQTISFTKGCYLGQETVARLDAMGQVQKKLVRWSIDGAVPPAQTKLEHEGKTVGRLTSVAQHDDGSVVALGFARRSHFDAGAVASGESASSGTSNTDFSFTAQVIES
ncbi:YgfZ/GcvT domain-containing protein [Novipirellula herctigrandis]